MLLRCAMSKKGHPTPLTGQTTGDEMPFGRQRFSLIYQLIASALLLVLVLVALTGWHVYHTYQLALSRSQANTLNLTHALSQHANDTFMQAQTLLSNLTGQVDVIGSEPAKRAALHQLFAEKASLLPQVHGIALYDSQGQMIVTTADALPANTDYADRDYFIWHRDHADTGAHIGKVIRSRMTSDLILPISMRVNHPDGSFAGVIMESVVINYFRNFYAKFVISDDSTLIMMLNNGTVLLRQPFDEKAIGSSLSDSALFKEHIQQHSSGTMTGSLGGETSAKIFTYNHLQQFPVVITTGMSVDQALVDWKKDALSHVVLVVIFLLLIVFTSLMLTRQVRIRMRIEQELLHAQQELRKLNRSLETLARSDGLTGLYNRRHFDLSMANEFNRSMQHQGSLGIILLDIDYFKQFNDLYGHVAGDECLKQIGAALRRLPLRPRDLVARYGGEEFIILLPDTDHAGTRAVAERAYQEIVGLNIAHQASPTGTLTPSIGVYLGDPQPGQDTPSKMITHADAALYQAKGQGRNRICEY